MVAGKSAKSGRRLARVGGRGVGVVHVVLGVAVVHGHPGCRCGRAIGQVGRGVAGVGPAECRVARARLVRARSQQGQAWRGARLSQRAQCVLWARLWRRAHAATYAGPLAWAGVARGMAGSMRGQP